MTTLTVYPDAHTESTTVDGVVRQTGTWKIWSDLRNSAGTDAFPSIDYTSIVYAMTGYPSPGWGVMIRSIFLFDTSSLGSGATISTTTLSIRGLSKSDSVGASPDVDIYTSAPASNTDLVAGDFDSLGITSQTGNNPITYANWSTTAYNNFTFDATGLGNVSKTEVSKFGVRNANHDVANVAPTWVENKTYDVAGYFSDYTGTTIDPKLVVTYTSGTTYNDSLTLSGASSIVETNIATVNNSLVLSGASSIVDTNIADVLNSLTLSGTSGINILNIMNMLDSLALSGISSITEVVLKELNPNLALSGISSITETNIATVNNVLTLSGTSTITETNIATVNNVLTLSGTSTITETVLRELNPSIILTGTSSITETNIATIYNVLVLSSTGSITESVLKELNSSITLSGISSITESNIAELVNSLTLSGTSSITESNIATVLNSLTLTGISTIIIAAGVVAASGGTMTFATWLKWRMVWGK